jgi:hypothetical protein
MGGGETDSHREFRLSDVCKRCLRLPSRTINETNQSIYKSMRTIREDNQRGQSERTISEDNQRGQSERTISEDNQRGQSVRTISEDNQ